MIKRTTQAAIQAAKMDPARRELYVEGVSDKLLLEYLFDTSMAPSVRVFAIDQAIELAITDQGAKGRILEFGKLVDSSGVRNLRFLVDSDLDQLFGHHYGASIFSTHLPDIESYFISVQNLDKLLRAALALTSIRAKDLHDWISQFASQIGLVRYAAKKSNYTLSITKTNKSKCVDVRQGVPILDFDKMVLCIWQNSTNKPTLANLTRVIEACRAEYENFSLNHRIRGKDYLEMLEITSNKLNAGKKITGDLLRATLEEDRILNDAALQPVVNFLRFGSI